MRWVLPVLVAACVIFWLLVVLAAQEAGLL